MIVLDSLKWADTAVNLEQLNFYNGSAIAPSKLR